MNHVQKLPGQGLFLCIFVSLKDIYSQSAVQLLNKNSSDDIRLKLLQLINGKINLIN